MSHAKSQIVLALITLGALGVMMALLSMPVGTSITRLDVGGVYQNVELTTVVLAGLAAMLWRAHRYAFRLTMIAVFGLIVLLVGWGLRSV